VEIRTLGGSGLRVSVYALGAMSFGRLGNTDHDDCARIVHRALDAGINLVDTADVYSAGESEEIVGRALAGRRDDVVLATKCFWPMGDDPNRRGLSRRWIVRACEESLRRLGTDWIDVYYLHKPDPATDLEESLGAMSDLVHQGKVRTVGMSTFPADAIVEAQWVAARRNLERPRAEQPPYSILARHVERDVLPACQRYGMGVLVWGPLNSGWLTGKYRRDAGLPAGSRATRWQPSGGRAFDEGRSEVRAKLDVLDGLAGVADEAGVSLAHLALAFTVEHPAVSSTILGPRTGDQLDDLLAAADLRLDADVLDAVDALVPPGTDLDPACDTGWVAPWIADPARRRRSGGRRAATAAGQAG
jgi:aryl-alcohol dehydrogenase-like predicted oxidoreductase